MSKKEKGMEQKNTKWQVYETKGRHGMENAKERDGKEKKTRRDAQEYEAVRNSGKSCCMRNCKKFKGKGKERKLNERK